MDTTTSADGTTIAYYREGEGPVAVIVCGAFSVARAISEFATALAEAGFTAVSYDRRARDQSGDTKPYAPEREAEDLAAVVAAVGGAAATVGHSSGAVLTLYAASLGRDLGHLFLSEPPFRFGEHEPAADLPERLQQLVDSGDEGAAVKTFQLEGVGLAPELVEQISQSPLFGTLKTLAQSTVYDATLTRQVSTPTAEMTGVAGEVTILVGADTFPFLAGAARQLGEAMPQAELLEVPESVGHRVDAVATARILAERVLR